jgi:hypothetical protein
LIVDNNRDVFYVLALGGENDAFPIIKFLIVHRMTRPKRKDSKFLAVIQSVECSSTRG